MAVLLFLISPYLGVSALVFGTIQALVAWLNERSTKPPLMQANQTAIEAQRYADGALRDAEVIHAMGMLRSFAFALGAASTQVLAIACAGISGGRWLSGGDSSGTEHFEFATAGVGLLSVAA